MPLVKLQDLPRCQKMPIWFHRNRAHYEFEKRCVYCEFPRGDDSPPADTTPTVSFRLSVGGTPGKSDPLIDPLGVASALG